MKKRSTADILIDGMVEHVIGKGYGLLHEIPDQLGITKGLTKWAEIIEKRENASEITKNTGGKNGKA